MSWKVEHKKQHQQKQERKNSTQIQTLYIYIKYKACVHSEREYIIFINIRGPETQCVAKQTETACGLIKKIMRKEKNNNETADMHTVQYTIILNAIFMCRKHAQRKTCDFFVETKKIRIV